MSFPGYPQLEPPLLVPQPTPQKTNWTPAAAQPNATTYVDSAITDAQIRAEFGIVDVQQDMMLQQCQLLVGIPPQAPTSLPIESAVTGEKCSTP